MRAGLKGVLLVSALAALSAAAVGAGAEDADRTLMERAGAVFSALPKDAGSAEHPLTDDLVDLGRMLFFEPRVSTDGVMSCAACHQAILYGTDAMQTSTGNSGKKLPRNVPTVFNTALQFAQHYGGNRKDVEEQATKALISPLAYGNADYATAEAKLKAIAGYREPFAKAFPGESNPINAQNWGKAIGAYERTLLTPSPFDRFLMGDTRSLDAKAKRGLDKFMTFGCSGCHNGVTVGGQMYQKFGITADYWTLTGSKNIDKGRFNDTKNEADTYMFKVPQLRNVARTPPYFHDGSVSELGDAVRIMGKLQLGRDLTADDVGDIVAFLETLTGDVPMTFAQVPTLPVGPFHP